jgi:hypothetical protein
MLKPPRVLSNGFSLIGIRQRRMEDIPSEIGVCLVISQVLLGVFGVLVVNRVGGWEFLIPNS